MYIELLRRLIRPFQCIQNIWGIFIILIIDTKLYFLEKIRKEFAKFSDVLTT